LFKKKIKYHEKIINIQIYNSLSYSLYIKGLRGTTADVIILEEAAFVDVRLWQTVIVPLLGVDNTALLAISTPNDEDNYYSELLYKTDDQGNLLFKVVKIGLSCDECKDKGEAAKCKHKLGELPSWKSKHGQALQAKLLPPDIYTRESMALVSSSKNYAFNKIDIDAMFANNNYSFKNSVGVIFVSIDPNGGSQTKSSMSIISTTRNTKGEIMVCFFFNIFVGSEGEVRGR
jgi:hypothetical protein